MGHIVLKRMLDVLIIGCGNIAGRFDEGRDATAGRLTHAGAFGAHGGFTLKACVDPDKARRAVFQAYWEVDQGADSVEALGAPAGRFDVISICSPTSLHDTHLAAGLALQPKLVFAEKPLTGSVAATDEWVQRYAAAGVLLAVNHTRRWAADVVELAAALAAGRYGRVRSASGHYTKGILNNGGHMIDLLAMLLGPMELIAAGDAVWDHWPDDPSVPALLRTANGVPVTLNVGHAGDYALFELRLVTEHGVIAMIDGGMTWEKRDVVPNPDFPGYRALGPAVRQDGRYTGAMAAAAENIHRAITYGDALACDGAVALTAQRLCEAIRAAALASGGSRDPD